MDPGYVRSRIINGVYKYERVLVKAPTAKEKSAMLAAKKRLAQRGVSPDERKQCNDLIFDYNRRVIGCFGTADNPTDGYVTLGPTYSTTPDFDSAGDKLAGSVPPPAPDDGESGESRKRLYVEDYDEKQITKKPRAPADWNAAGKGASSGRDTKDFDFPSA